VRRRVIPARALLVAGDAAVLAAAAYELAVALGWIPLGNEEGEGPTGEDTAVAIAFGVLLVGGIVAIGAAIGGGRYARWPWVALPLTGAALVGARFFTYDPYYLPELRRLSDGGVVTGTWVVLVVVFCLLAALLTALRLRVGLPLVGVTAIVCGFTAAFAGTGH
jgi:hypothetical protein